MKLIVGLGNPGKEYENTRHNAGASFVNFLAQQKGVNFTNKFQSLFAEFQANGEKIMLLKPQTFMNLSGNAVQQAASFYKLQSEDIIICFDDLDITQGEFKVQKGKYPKVHNGVNDIIRKLGTDQFTYVRVGIEGRTPVEREFISGKEYVLQKLNADFTAVFAEIMKQLEV